MKNLRMSSKRRRKNKDNLDKQENEGDSSRIQTCAASEESKGTEGENMQIEENAPIDKSKEITEGKSVQIQEQENTGNI